MILTSAKIGPFRSISQAQEIEIDEEVTVLVGMNEAGKTVFLRALEKTNDALGLAKFNPTDDYPRKDLARYLKKHDVEPDRVCTLRFILNPEEIEGLKEHLRVELGEDFSFTVSQNYKNERSVGLVVSEKDEIQRIIENEELSTDLRDTIRKATSIRQIPELSKDIGQTQADKSFLDQLQIRISKSSWASVLSYEVWTWLSPRIPKFLYFGEYDLLPSKVNLNDLMQREANSRTDPKQLTAQHRAVLALLRMADISTGDFTNSGGYETLKAKIEGVSINLTDQVLEFWKQNEDLEVEVDIKPDPQDSSPFNSGPNLYLRIKNRRHRGVSTPFDQRSRGFIWFFSFLVWFDSVQNQLGGSPRSENNDLVLLLDEPGLALHALAQADFLRYIDDLSSRHQVLYTTHSPFMVHADRLHQVRVVEDKKTVGTVISSTVSGSDPRTIFPLQAALGWTIAQNLFISTRNLIVEGPSDLTYLRIVSSILESVGREHLRSDITITPVGGLDKVVTFIALLGANKLELAVLHDFRGAPEQRLVDLAAQKLISPKAIVEPSQFRDVKLRGKPSDIEDLFSTSDYLAMFNRTYLKQLPAAISEQDLPPGDRIIARIEQYLDSKSLKLRSKGGFNHFVVASTFAGTTSAHLDETSLNQFEKLFVLVNSLFSE